MSDGDTPHVTRDVDPDALADLRDHPPRASLAFVADGEVQLLPVRARHLDGAYRFGVPASAALDLSEREVVLVIDSGPFWFELRGLSVRGTALRTADSGDGLSWYAIDTRRILAWDYSSLREER